MPETTANAGSPFKKAAATLAAVVLIIAITWLKSHSGSLGVGQGPQSTFGLSRSYDLSRDENLGGHTLQRHVGRTDDQLRHRLDRERDIAAASTYTDRSAAEQTVGAALTQDHDRVQAWLNRNDSHPNLALHFHGNTTIGRSIRRGAPNAVTCSNAVVVLRWDGDQRFHVLTTYPEADHGR